MRFMRSPSLAWAAMHRYVLLQEIVKRRTVTPSTQPRVTLCLPPPKLGAPPGFRRSVARKSSVWPNRMNSSESWAEPDWCRWATNSRLLCGLRATVRDGTRAYCKSSTILMSALDGGPLLRSRTSRSNGAANGNALLMAAWIHSG